MSTFESICISLWILFTVALMAGFLDSLRDKYGISALYWFAGGSLVFAYVVGGWIDGVRVFGRGGPDQYKLPEVLARNAEVRASRSNEQRRGSSERSTASAARRRSRAYRLGRWVREKRRNSQR